MHSLASIEIVTDTVTGVSISTATCLGRQTIRIAPISSFSRGAHTDDPSALWSRLFISAKDVIEERLRVYVALIVSEQRSSALASRALVSPVSRYGHHDVQDP